MPLTAAAVPTADATAISSIMAKDAACASGDVKGWLARAAPYAVNCCAVGGRGGALALNIVPLALQSGSGSSSSNAKPAGTVYPQGLLDHR